MILIKNIHVYAPEDKGINDVLLAGRQIVKIDQKIEVSDELVKIIDGSGKKLVPGFIDPHVHITGGGGEGGIHTRVPELGLSTFVEGGITTVVGLLGTDGVSRSVEALLSKAKALNKEGITAHILTGSYRYPTITLTGDVQKDLVFLSECIGVKLAISDHRSSMVSNEEIARLASDIRVSGMISGKAGIMTLHMGDGKYGLKQIFNILEETDLPITVFRPTHVNRKIELLNQSFEFAKMGGYIDLTCKINPECEPSQVISEAKAKQVPMDRITISSDGGGSWSSYDNDGKLIEMGVSGVDSLLETLKNMVFNTDISLSEALSFMTSNTAKSLKFDLKGHIIESYDADLLILDETLNIESVFANGKLLYSDYKMIKKGTFE